MIITGDQLWPQVHVQTPSVNQGPNEITALTARLARGHEEAWREFFERYFSRLLRYLLVLHRGREDLAREAVQLTLLRAAKHMRAFHSEEALWRWLTVLARSAVVDEARKKNRYLNFLARFRQEPPPATATDPRLEMALDHCLALLTSEERCLLEQKYFDGASVREIAELGGASEKAIESRLSRVRRKLKTILLKHLRHEAGL
ncbi:MAG: RNA polymerase sigma factor [Verrucomicrobiales bacterium]